MILIYASRTNNIERIVRKLSFPKEKIVSLSEASTKVMKDKFCLLTYTDFLGQIPEEVSAFLDMNKDNLVAVAGSGNRNFGDNFCGAAKKIHSFYNVPLIATFELSGDARSIEEFDEKLNTGSFGQ